MTEGEPVRPGSPLRARARAGTIGLKLLKANRYDPALLSEPHPSSPLIFSRVVRKNYSTCIIFSYDPGPGTSLDCMGRRAHEHKITYAPINLTALCVIFSGSPFFNTRGNGPWNSRLFWVPNRTRLTARAISLAPKKSRVPGPIPPRNEQWAPEKITHGAVKFTGA